MILDDTHFEIKLAETEAELAAAQRLRYRVFVEELGARPGGAGRADGRESDRFDPFYDHLILKDRRIADDRADVVGVYRVMLGTKQHDGHGFYSAAEYDLQKLTGSGRPIAELGRSCVDVDYRGGAVLHLLWMGLADYVAKHRIEVLFGVASFAGVTVQDHADALSWLHQRYLAPKAIRVQAHGEGAISMDLKPMDKIDAVAAVRQIPPLLKSYLRMGGCVGAGAYLDHAFNTTDVCLVMDMDRVPKARRVQYAAGSAG